ncbi:MAG TPA: LacI family DNA-binding transcriptional regulator [Capsulimonadaceae bacterium]|jgi:DNA-binding LacI/PurR family transcriptional regulator
MARYRKSTIKEVAARAGVSVTTVSYFVSGREDVCSPQTAERIRSAVADLHYTPSSLVAGMQKGIRHSIGAMITSPWDSDIQYAGFFFERIWRGVFEQADKDDYSILRYSANVRYSDRADMFLDGRVDGVLYHAHTDDNDRPAQIAKAGLPIVLITRSINIPEGCGAVYTDEAAVTHVALDHLWSLGHRRIGHLAGPVTPTSELEVVDDIAIARMRAYKSWMVEHEAHDPTLLRAANAWNGADAAPHVDAWRSLESPPTAILCANDDIAVSVIDHANGCGWKVPHTLSVVGIDNSNEAKALTRNLTSIDPQIHLLGREAMSCVQNIINGERAQDNRKAVGGAQWIDRGTVSAA